MADRFVLVQDKEISSAFVHPSSNVFRPITPPYVYQQVRARRGSIYDQPCGHYVDSGSVVSSRPIRIKESFSSGERDTLMETLGGQKPEENKTRPKRSIRRQLLNNVFDFIAIAGTCIIFGLIYLFVNPNQRGFFCDDTSIQYPYRSDTIPMWLLGIYGGIGPVVIFFIVELWVVRPFSCGRRSTKKGVHQRRVDYIKVLIETIFLFGLGIAICFLITEVGKRTIGRLRPYYLTICNPVWANIQCTKNVTTASGMVSIYQYVTDHNCSSSFSAADLREAKLSFPSGHASYSTFAFVFLFVYFEARLVCPNIQFLKPFLQCVCIAIAFFTCLSRVTDYKHHPTDVIGGAIIGFSIAVFAAVRVGTYLWSFSVYCETEDETKKDRLPDDERVHIAGLETRQNGGLRQNNDTPLDMIHHSQPSGNIRVPVTVENRFPSERNVQTGSYYPSNNGPRRVAPARQESDFTV